MEKSNRLKVFVTTMISALLFCALIVVASLSPLAETGAAANEFNSVGMWVAIAMILFLYAIPLIIYMLGVEGMRFVMVILCSIGILINMTTMGIIFLIGTRMDLSPHSAVMVGICSASIVVNLILFFQAFRKQEETRHQNLDRN